MMIEIEGLALEYEVRVLAPGSSWFRNLFYGRYEKHPVLKGIDLTIGGRGITAILGKNGAGKTTLMKILSGILTPTAGRVRVLDHEPARRHADFLRRIGVVFGQKKMLWPELSLRENMAMTRAVYRVAGEAGRAKAQDLIGLFRLEALADRPAKSLSLGESMKAEMANILLHDPRLLFLDEPTIGLDVSSQREMRAAVKAYAENHDCHVLLTSHSMKDVAALADRVLLLENGRLSEIRRVEDDPADFEAQLEARMVAL
jgi:ABC-2 type transport system ATP-binding protein